jgi:hypothetical protein
VRVGCMQGRKHKHNQRRAAHQPSGL